MPKTTHRNTWKQRERDAAAIFGTRRQRCSGSSGIEGQTFAKLGEIVLDEDDWKCVADMFRRAEFIQDAS